MTPPSEAELQEAASRRFGGGTLMLQPLESGHWAIRGDDWGLLAIFDPGEMTMADFAEVVAEFSAKGRARHQRELLPQGYSVAWEESRPSRGQLLEIAAAAEDLGL